MQDQNDQKISPQKEPSFVKKIWMIAAIVAFLIIVSVIVKNTFSVFLLVLAGTLVAVFFTALSNFIHRKTKWKEGFCVGISIVGTLLIIAGLFWLIGAKVESQSSQLMDTVPKTFEMVKEKINQSTIGKKVLEKLSSKNSVDKAQGVAGDFFQSTFGVFGDVYVILFIGIFFSVSPKTYTHGLVQLIPKAGQEKAQKLIDKIGTELRSWLKGKLFSMFVVFVLTAIGLAIMGMPLWLVLALLAGLISFIPNFGPLIALIPAVLVALMQSPEKAMLVVALYIVIQFIESNFITPLVQQKLLNLPPALIIISQLLMGSLTGGWGLVLATPLTVIVIVLVQELYVKNRN